MVGRKRLKRFCADFLISYLSVYEGIKTPAHKPVFLFLNQLFI